MRFLFIPLMLIASLASAATMSGVFRMAQSTAGGSAPYAPTSVVATAGNASIATTWAAGSGSTSSLFRRGGATGVYGAYSTATSGRVVTGTNGVTQYIQVGALNSYGTTWASEVTATPTANLFADTFDGTGALNGTDYTLANTNLGTITGGAMDRSSDKARFAMTKASGSYVDEQFTINTPIPFTTQHIRVTFDFTSPSNTSWNALQVGFLPSIAPSTGYYGVGGPYFYVGITPTGITNTYRNSGGTETNASATYSNSPATSSTHSYKIELTKSGSTITSTVYLDSTSVKTDTLSSFNGGTSLNTMYLNFALGTVSATTIIGYIDNLVVSNF